MRMLLTVKMPTARANAAAQDGSLPRTIQATTAALKPEAAYIAPLDGKRAVLFVFDMKDASQIPAITEPLFTALDAELSLTPVMNAEDLQKGLPEVLAALSVG